MENSPNNRMQRIVSNRAEPGTDYSAPRKLNAKEIDRAATAALARRGIKPRKVGPMEGHRRTVEAWDASSDLEAAHQRWRDDQGNPS